MNIVLINMPFADANRPSLSLTQLRARALMLPEVSTCNILYVNQSAALFFEAKLFAAIADQYIKGLGDWLFRQIAFPEAEDNAAAYFERHFPYSDPHSLALKHRLLELRNGLEPWLEHIIDRNNLERADLVGFTSMFSQNTASFAMARLLKRRNPKLITIIGGANCESPMGQEIARHVPAIDYVFSGPALINFPQLIGHLAHNENEACASLAGVFCKHNLNTLAKSALAGRELGIDEALTLDYSSFLDDYDQNFPQFPREKKLTFETSRGCWWGERSHCTFCGLNSQTMAYRSMNSDNAAAKLREILAYSDRCSHFTAVDNIMPRNLIDEVLPTLEVPEHVEIFYEVKADLKDEELAALARKRVTRVQPGIEALYTKTLKLMKKGTTAFGNIRFLKSCLRHGVTPEWNLLVGFPGEGEDSYKSYLDLLPLLGHLPPPGGCYPVRFDRYSPYHGRAESFGLKLKPYDFYRDVFPFPESALENLAYYFQDHDFKAEYSRVMLKYIGRLSALIDQWRTRFEQDRPQLVWVGSKSVRDTRLRAHEWRLSEVEARLLKLLDEFKAPSSLVSMSGYSSKEVENGLISLLEKRLLFQEETRYGSLVCG